MEFGNGQGEVLSEAAVGGGQIGNGGAIRGGGRGQVGDGHGGVVLKFQGCIGIVIAGLACSYLRFAEFLMGCGERGFEVDPHVFVGGVSAPMAAGVLKQTSVEN